MVDLSSELIVAAEIYHADVADCHTLVDSVMMAQINLNEAGAEQQIEEAVGDKGYLSEATLELAAELDLRTYIPEKQGPAETKGERSAAAAATTKTESGVAAKAPVKARRKRAAASGASPAGQRAILNNRRRMARAKGKRLQRLRSERVERSFAHVCETGGARRSWLTGLEDVTKRYRIAAQRRTTWVGSCDCCSAWASRRGFRACARLPCSCSFSLRCWKRCISVSTTSPPDRCRREFAAASS